MKMVFLDWNGTLLNDVPIWYAAVLNIFSHFGKEPPSIPEYFTELECDLERIYTSRGISATREELNVMYRAYYMKHMREAHLAAGARDALRKLKKHGVGIWLLTAQEEDLTTPLLKKFRIVSYFRGLRFHAIDKSEAVKQILAQEGVEPSDCYLVGDAPSDMRHARKAEIIPVAFFGGHIPAGHLFQKDIVLGCHKYFLISHFNDLTWVVLGL